MWPNSQETADLVTFIEEILNEKLHFMCNDILAGDLAYVVVGRMIFSCHNSYLLQEYFS